MTLDTHLANVGAAAVLDGLNLGAASHHKVAIIATTVEGDVVYWNAAAEQLYGWRRDEAVGRNVVTLKASAQNREQAQEVMRTLQAGHSWSGEIVLRRRNGAPFTAFVADLPVGDGPDGLIVGVSAPTERRDAVLEFHAGLLGAVERLGGTAA